MSERQIFPFGFMSEHLHRQMERRKMVAASIDALGDQRIVAIGVPDADDSRDAEKTLAKLLPFLDAVILYDGMRFEGKARERSRNALLTVLREHDVPVQIFDEEAVSTSVRGEWLNMTMNAVFDHIANELLKSIPPPPPAAQVSSATL